MLVVGGIAPLNNYSLPIWTTQVCDNNTMFSQGLAMFSLNDHSWSSNYDPAASAKPYGIHASISKVIGGNATGGSTIRAPISGFNQQALGALLVPNKTKNTSTNQDKKSAKHNPFGMRISVGAAAGIIAAGGTFVILGIAGALYIYTKRRRSRTEEAAELSAQRAQAEFSHKKLAEMGADLPPVELAGEKHRSGERKGFMGRSELGDVKEWVFELGTASVKDKSLPPTPRTSKSIKVWLSPTPDKERSDSTW